MDEKGTEGQEQTTEQTEKMIPLKEVRWLLGYIERGLRTESERARDTGTPPQADPVLLIAYDKAAAVAGWPLSKDIFKDHLLGCHRPGG